MSLLAAKSIEFVVSFAPDTKACCPLTTLSFQTYDGSDTLEW
jgi:hypothetical protein